MLNPASPLTKLFNAAVRPGRLEWIGLRRARHAPMRVVETAWLTPAEGLLGDHYAGRPGGARQVSLIGTENLAAIASYLGRDTVPPELLRRNLLVEGINLLALKDRQIRIGSAILEITGECHPCSRMEQLLGPGGYNAVRGTGGILARVVSGGSIRVTDTIERVELLASP